MKRVLSFGMAVLLACTLFPLSTQAQGSSLTGVTTSQTRPIDEDNRAGSLILPDEGSSTGIGSSDSVQVISIDLSTRESSASTTSSVGTTLQLDADVLPTDATNNAVTWSSSDASVATVNGSGLVSGVAAGSATIRAEACDGSGVYGEIVIAVESAAFSEEGTGIDAGASLSLEFSDYKTKDTDGAAHYVMPCTAGDTLDVELTVLTNGTLTFRWQVYDAEIETGDKYIDIDLKTNNTANKDKLNLTVTDDMLNAVDLYRCVATASLGDETQIAYAYFTLETEEYNQPGSVSEQVSIATIDITASYGVNYVQMDAALQLSATVLPENAANKTVVWTSSDETIATVDRIGLVTPVASGAVTITATAQDGSTVSGIYELVVVDVPMSFSAMDAPMLMSTEWNSLTASTPVTVSFSSNGGNSTPSRITVYTGSAYGTLPVVSKTGYSFVGWYTAQSGGDLITASTTVTNASIHTLYAHWTPNTYSVSLNANGGSVSTSSITVTYASTYGTLPTPTRPSYIFTGWYTEPSGGTYVTSSSTVQIAYNHTLYARWAVITYIVTFDANGGTVNTQSIAVANNGTISNLPTPIRTGYRFVGWFCGRNYSNEFNTSTVVTNYITVYAHWARSSNAGYKINFDANGGSLPTSIKTSALTGINTIRGAGDLIAYDWFEASVATSSNGCEVSVNASGVATAIRSYGSASNLTVPTDGFVLSADSESTSSAYSFVQNISIGHYVGLNYATGSVSIYDSMDGYLAEQKYVIIGRTYGALPTPTRDNYTFDGWYTAASGGTKITSESVYSESALFAHWTPVVTNTTYTVSYDANGGTNIPDSQTQYIGSAITLSQVHMLRTGYDFQGWATSSTATSAQYHPLESYSGTEDITLYAVWQRCSYKVSFHANGGTGAPEPQYKVYGQILTLSNIEPTWEGYTFRGWATSSAAIETEYQAGGVYAVDTAQTLYAIWDNVQTHIYTSVITPPTCSEPGYTTYTCLCGHTYADNYTEATGLHELSRYEADYTECGGGFHVPYLWCSVCYQFFNIDGSDFDWDNGYSIGTGMHTLEPYDTGYVECNGGYVNAWYCTVCGEICDKDGNEYDLEQNHVEGTGRHSLEQYEADYTECGGGFTRPFAWCSLCGQVFNPDGTEYDFETGYAEGNGAHSLEQYDVDYTECGGGFTCPYARCSICGLVFNPDGTEFDWDSGYAQGDDKHTLETCAADYTECSGGFLTPYLLCTVCENVFALDVSDFDFENGYAFGTGKHTYGQPQWSWSGNNAANAIFTCTSGDDEQVVAASVTSLQTGSTITYSAYVVFNGMLYGDSKTVEGWEVKVDLSGIDCGNTVYINGQPYDMSKDNSIGTVVLENSKAQCMVAYLYGATDNSGDLHKSYPTSMTVWLLTYDESTGRYTATRAEQLDDVLRYAGSSIRITGNKGIRMITSVPSNLKEILTGNGLYGYTLAEYGTCVAWASEMGSSQLVLGQSYTRAACAYKRGVSDPIYKITNGMTQYTNVLVGFSNDQCIPDLAMRPYMILENESGQQVTLYGGVIYRNIGYIAYQNRNVFAPGSTSYEYIWGIIHHVYGKQYDADYKG